MLTHAMNRSTFTDDVSAIETDNLTTRITISDNLQGFGIAPWLAIPVMAFLALYLIYRPLGKAGDPDEAAPPAAM